MSLLSSPSLLNSARWRNMRVGLLGGSFNPPHKGHVHISLAAMRTLELDAVWWLITPQNPMKSLTPMPLERRLKLANDLTQDHPRIIVSDIERHMGTNITYDTIKGLNKYFVNTDFVWISGLDNARSLHKWNKWERLLEEICMAHITRTPAKSIVQNSPVRMKASQKHVCIHKPGQYSLEAGITYWMLEKQMINISSTEIRRKYI